MLCCIKVYSMCKQRHKVWNTKTKSEESSKDKINHIIILNQCINWAPHKQILCSTNYSQSKSFCLLLTQNTCYKPVLFCYPILQFTLSCSIKCDELYAKLFVIFKNAGSRFVSDDLVICQNISHTHTESTSIIMVSYNS